MADMTPGDSDEDDDEISEGSEVAPKPCFEVEGNPGNEELEVGLDLLGGGLLNEIRCLRNTKSGMASARLVPTN
jgi:hypothetical protein